MSADPARKKTILMAGLVLAIIFAAYILPRVILSDRSEPAVVQTGPSPTSVPDAAEAAVTAPEAAPGASEGKEIPKAPEPTPRAVGDIAGRVSDTTGEPIPGCEVIAVSHGDGSLERFRDRGRYRVSEPFAITDASGGFMVGNLVPGDYTVGFRASGYGYAEYPSTVRVSADQVTGGINQTLESGGVIFGEVLENVSAEPIAGATVSAMVASAKAHSREALATHKRFVVLTDARGKFRFDTLLPSELYDLVAAHPLYVSARIDSVAVDSGSPVRFALWSGGSIAGLVTRKTDDARVAGATITISAGKDFKREIRSATDGTFLVQGLDGGTYQLAAEKDGFYTQTLPEYTVPVDRAGEHSVDLLLVPGGAIELTVIDKETREAISGVEVTFYARRFSEKFTTDDEGKVRLTGLPERQLSCTAQADGYARGDRYSPDAWFDVKLEKAITRTVELEPERFFFGRVVNEEDEPVPGARVKVEMKSEGSTAHSVSLEPDVTDASGSFRIGGLGTGSYEFSVHKDGYARLNDHVSVPQQEEKKVILYRGATVEGTVSDGDGEPLEGFEVRLRSFYHGSTTAKATSDKNGAWEMTRIPAGSYTVTAQKEKQRTEVKKFELAWKDHKKIDLRLQEGFAVAGKVVDGKNEHGLEGIDLTLMTTDEMGYVRDFSHDQYRRETKTDASGEFLINGVPEGHYELQIRKHPGQYLPPTHDERTLITLKDADVTDLVIKLKQMAIVRGKVLLPSGEPAVGAEVGVDHADHMLTLAHHTKKTGSEGEFEVTGLHPAKDYRLCAKLAGFGAAISEPFGLRQGDVIENMILRLRMPGSLSGSIKDTSGKPLSTGYFVSCRFPQASEEHSNTTRLAYVTPDESGRYEMQNLPPGELRILLWGEGPCYGGGSGCRSVLQSKLATISSGEETSGVDFVVSSKDKDQSGHISGHVVSSGGLGIGGVTVQAFTGISDRHQPAQAVSQKDGSFLIDKIPEGTLSLYAYGQGYAHRKIDNVKSPSDNVRIVLKQYAGVEGRVIEQGTGQPVRDFLISHGASEGGLRDQSFTDSEGKFRLANLAPGPYLLRARAKPSGIAETKLDLREGEVEQVVLGLRPSCQVAGRVVRKTDRSAVRGAVVEPGTDRKAVTGYDGRFIATGFYPGQVTLTVEHPDYGTQQFPDVQTSEPGMGREVYLELETPGRIEGHVYDRSGVPWEGVQIQVDEDWKTKKISDYNGLYVFPTIPPGKHTVTWRVDVRRNGGNWKRTVDVEPGRTTVVDFGVANTFVSGIVTENGTPKYLEVVTFKSPHTERWVQVDRDGRFEIFGLPPGIYTVTAKRPGSDTSWTERTVEVRGGEEIFLEFEKP